MEQFLTLIQNLKESIHKKDSFNPSISNKSVLWHIEHTSLAIEQIYENLKTSNPADYKAKFTFLWFIVKWTKNIPRGKGQAPKAATPKENIDLEKLNHRLNNLSNILIDLENLPADSFIEHHVFGTLKTNATLKFLYIHTLHHSKIIQDIIG